MEDFQSKYSGEQVEEMLDQIANGDIGGGIDAETDPIFSASPAASITEEKKAEWDNKVDKVSGKQLSTEDFTSTLKTKLEGLSNYDDTELSNALSTLRGDFDKLVSGDTTTAIKTFNEIIAFLDGIQDSQDLSSIIASIEQQIADKMDKVTLATVATSGSYNDLSNKPTIPNEQVNSDWNATSGKAQILNKPTIPTSLSQLSEDSTHRVVTDTEKSTWNAKSDFNGDYNSLKNKPTIPSAVTESTVSGWGFTKNKGTYSKPSTGIPKTDLASAVQTSLGKADNAFTGSINGFKERNLWLASGVKINGDTKTPNSEGIVDLGTIEGGDSSGDSRFFMNTTVERIIAAKTGEITMSNEDFVALYTACAQNKIICVPYEDYKKGYLIISYKYDEWAVSFSMFEEGVYYYISLGTSDGVSFYMYGDTPKPLLPLITYIDSADYEAYPSDNEIFIATTPLNSLYIEPNDPFLSPLLIGVTVCFVAGENFTLELMHQFAGGEVKWANGVPTDIEPGVFYELSIRQDYNMLSIYYLVLTPFKSAT